MVISTRAIIIVGALVVIGAIGFALTRPKPNPPQPIAAVEILAPSVPAADTQAPDVATAPVDDTPMSGTLIGRPETSDATTSNTDPTLKAEADEAAARLDAIDEQARTQTQAEAIAIERARTDAAVAQARALSDQNAVLRQQTQDAEYARTQAEQAAYEAQQQQPAVVFIQPNYRDQRFGNRDGRYPHPNDNHRPLPNTGVERKNVVTPSSGLQSQPAQPQSSTASKPMPQSGGIGNAVANRQAPMVPDNGKTNQQ